EQQQNTDSTLLKEKRYDEIASFVVTALGGKENKTNVDNCITRLRIDLKEKRDVDKNLLNTSGCTGFFFPVAKHIHLVFGPQVESVKCVMHDEINPNSNNI